MVWTLYYADRLPKQIINESIKNLNNKHTAKLIGKIYANEYKVTRTEWKRIRIQLVQAIQDSLPDSLLRDSKSMSVDSIHYTVESHNKSVTDLVVKLPTAERPQAPCILKWAFYFSKPIYIRNQTILFYFFMYYRQSSGSNAFYLSKQVNGRWEKGIFITGGAW